MKTLKRTLASIALTILCLNSKLALASGSDSGNELLTRFQTERLSAMQKVNLVQESLHSLDLRDRILFYSVALQKIRNYGLPQVSTDRFFLAALADLKQVPQGMFPERTGFGDDGALTSLAEWMMNAAMSNDGVSAPVAKKFVAAFFKMPWLDTLIVQNVALSVGHDKNLQYPYLHFIVAQLLRTHFTLPADYDSVIAFDILGSIRYKTYSNGKNDFTSYGFSYKDAIWLLDTVMKQGKIGAEGRKGLPELRREFELGAEFESKAGAGASASQSSDAAAINRAADVMKQMILKPGNAPFLAEVLVTWLLKVNLSTDKQVDLIETLLHELEKEPQTAFFIEFQYSIRGAHDALIDMPLVLNLPKRVQEDIYSLIIRKNAGDDAKSRRARQEIVIFDFGNKTKYGLPGIQFAMEMLAETATPGDSVTQFIGDETKLENSSVGELMGHIADCESARPYAGTNRLACAGVTSKQAIFEKIAANPMILPVLRERARGLLGR